VIFKNRNDAIKALNYVNNKGGINIDGVPLTCDWADVIDEDDNSSKQIFISGLKEDVSEDSLKDVFSSYGMIESIILSREHKNSKRKDLAFITYNTHEEAKEAVEDYKLKQDNQVDAGSILGDRVCVSLAFSQQAMQNKKKIKESRRKTPGTSEMPNILPKSITGGIAVDSRHGNISNIGNMSVSALPNVFSGILPQNLQTNSASQGIDINSVNPNSQNTTALLTMMNLLNMNKVTIILIIID
jgi:RNA recognition motif-containing protein